MNCRVCERPVEQHQRFCGNCGAPIGGVSGQNVSTGGGDVHGGLYQAGRDVVVNPVPSTPPSATYEAVPKWRSPFTQSVLSWLGLFVGLASVFPLWKLLEPIFSLFAKGLVPTEPSSGQAWWFGAFGLLLMILAVALWLRRLTKYQLRQPLFLGWAMSGAGRRITLERIHAGSCPYCGGRMRYYSRPTRRTEHIDADGNRRREVTERVPALECKRNAKHWFEVDPAEVEES